jgi:hypothetical protein
VKKHTQGPWWLDHDKSIVGANDEEVCNLNYSPDDEDDEIRMKADADLIATAPDLYEILEKINTAFYTRTSKKEWLELMEKTKPLLQRARGA